MNAGITAWLLDTVDHWVYIADKNLAFAEGFARSESAFTKLPNAVPHTDGTFPFSRHDLGIEEDAFVFGVASRAIHAKGWAFAVGALRELKSLTTRPLHLVLCGDGDDHDALKGAYGHESGVHFLGFQDDIQAFYRLCDCCVLPTRFVGESYPLTIIEAILAGIPCIATDIGEVRTILSIDDAPMGLIVPLDDDDSVFAESVTRAMLRVLDKEVYARLSTAVEENQDRFSMDRLVDDYLAVYARVLGPLHGGGAIDHALPEADRSAG